MGLFGNAKRIPLRHGGSLERMAWNASSCAPRLVEVISDEPWGLSPREVDSPIASLSGRAFISSSRDLFQSNPIRSLRLVAVAPYLAELAQCEHLTMLARLDLTGNQIGPEGLKTLLASPYLSNLSELGLGRNGLGAAGIDVLHRFDGRGRIRKLELQDNGLSAGDVQKLLDSSAWPELSSLNLSNNALGPQSVKSFSLFGITDLEIEVIELGTTGAIQLAKSNLRPVALGIGFNRIGDPGVAELVHSDLLTQCSLLDLRGNLLRSADAIVESLKLGKLRSLDVRANPLGVSEVQKLRNRFGQAAVIS